MDGLSLTRRLVPRIKLIAVKQLAFDANTDVDKLVQRFEKEVEILRKLKHPNIISLLGFVKNIEKDRAWLIFPWASHGNVKQFLQTGNWEIPERVALIEDVSRGLSFLHSQNPPICHGDLKSLNIVVNQDFMAIIVDLGSARTLPRQKSKRSRPGRLLRPPLTGQAAGHSNLSIQSMISEMNSIAMHSASGPRWTTRWASPEVLEGGKTTLASDIWALGWVYWEIITDHLPFHHISNDLGVILRITQGELPPVSSNKKLAQLQSMCDLLVGCWQKKPRLRPTATECLEVIEQLPSARPSKIIMNNETGERTRSATLLNALGEMNFDLGNYDMAMNEYSKSLTISKSENDNELSSRVLENIGDIHHSEKRWEDAIDAYEEAHRLAHLAGFEGLHETVLCRLMDSYTEMGWLQEAQEVLDDIIIEPQDNRDWKVVVESLYKLGKASYTQGQYERATLVYQRARYIHRNKNDYVEPLYSLHHIAILYCLHGRYADAEEIFGKLKIVQDPPLASITDILISLRKPARSLDCKEKGDWADVLLRFGISLSNQGRLTGALAVYHEIRNIHELQGCRKEIAGTLQYIGHLYVKLEKYEAAELAYGEGYDICSADGDQPGEVKFLLGLAEVYCIEELYDDAVDTFKQARRISSKGGLAEPLVDTLNRLGEVYRLTEKYKDAAQAFRKAGRVAAEEDYLDGRAKALKGLGMTFADEERYEEALKRLKRAASIFRKIGDTKSLSKCNLAIEEIEEALDIVSDVES